MKDKLICHTNKAGEKVYDLEFVITGQSQRRLVAAPEVPPETPPKDLDNADSEGDPPEPPVASDATDSQPTPTARMEDGLVRDSWRLISCGQFWPSMDFFLPQMLDYGHEGGKVLKQAVAMINKTHPDLMWNHSMDVKDVAGHIENASWENSSDIPPGINADVVVDPEFDSKAAKGLLNGHIRNGSIGIQCSCIPSHKDMPEADFYQRQGQSVDGEIVRWLPKKMKAVRHMAMVAAGTGADPDAGKRVMGTDNKGLQTHTAEVKSMDKMIELLKSVLDKLAIDAIINADADFSETLSDRVIAKLGLLADADRKYNELAEKLQAIGASMKAEGEEDLSALATVERLPEILEMAEQGKRLVEFKVKEALDWFDKAHFSAEKKDPTAAEVRQRARIEKLTDLDHIEDLTVEYKAMAEKKFAPPRKSSQTPPLPADNTKGANYAYTPGEQDIRESAKKLLPGKQAKK